MKINFKKALYITFGSLISLTSYAQSVISSQPSTVIAITPQIGVALPSVAGTANTIRAMNAIALQNARDNKEQKNNTTSNSEKKEDNKNSSETNDNKETDKDKELKAAIMAKNTESENSKEGKGLPTSTPVTQPTEQPERVTGQVPINNKIIRTNDIRLWNTSSIEEKEEIGRQNLMNTLHHK